MTKTQNDFNHEIKVLNDLHYRHANIECHGGWGNNPEVMMLSRVSIINKGFIKDIKVDVSNPDEIKRTLVIKSTEYGHEFELPYDKIIGMTILSSHEQATLERYKAEKVKWEEALNHHKAQVNDISFPKEAKEMAQEMIEVYEFNLLHGKGLIEKGVKTFMWGF